MPEQHERTTSEPGGLSGIADVLGRDGDRVLTAWVAQGRQRSGGRGADDLQRDGAGVLDALADALRGGGARPDLEPVSRLLGDFTARRSRAGDRPAQTAGLVLALREALLDALPTTGAAEARLAAAREAARVVDELALGCFDSLLAGREDVISAQGEQLLELSTPVVRIWERVVAVPLVGTLDSARAQVVMESLLQAISDDGALVAILDITGVPTVDTLVAQHLLKTVAATRLMGADCIVSGIAPQTAQTMVQLGIDLSEVTTRASLADALALAIARVKAHAAWAAEA